MNENLGRNYIDTPKLETMPLRFDNVIFDFDSTLVSIEALDLLAELVLKNHPDKKEIMAEFDGITKQGMGTGEHLPFNESLAKRFAILIEHGATREQVQEASQTIAEKHITKSFLKYKEFFTSHPEKIWIISGGFKEMILPTTRKLGIPDDHVLANEFEYDEQGKISGFNADLPTAQEGGKTKQIQALGLSENSVIIGDGGTDADTKLNKVVKALIAFIKHAGKDREKLISNADLVTTDLGAAIEWSVDKSKL